MARIIPNHNTEPMFNAVETWKKDCLLNDGSLFEPGAAIWTLDNLLELKRNFVDHLDDGEGNFIEKFETQLKPAKPEAKKLAAELIWIGKLFSSSFNPQTKIDEIKTIWQWSGVNLNESSNKFLSEQILEGIIKPGTDFGVNFWRELAYLIITIIEFKKMNQEERSKLVFDNPWGFVQWLDRDIFDEIFSSIISKERITKDRALRQILPFYLYLDHFEMISVRNHKIQIIKYYNNVDAQNYPQMDIDKTLLDIRNRLTAEYGDKQFDFQTYKEQWSSGKAENKSVNEVNLTVFQIHHGQADGKQYLPSKQQKYCEGSQILLVGNNGRNSVFDHQLNIGDVFVHTWTDDNLVTRPRLIGIITSDCFTNKDTNTGENTSGWDCRRYEILKRSVNETSTINAARESCVRIHDPEKRA